MTDQLRFWDVKVRLPTKSDQDRFLSNVVHVPTGCWEWTGNTNKNGYGMFWWQGHKGYAHHFAYQAFKGALVDGLDIDHKCRNRKCVNPEHLELVTHSENVRRGLLGLALRSQVQTHCKRGHPFNEENTKFDPYGRRVCITCDRERKARWNRNHHEHMARKGRERYHRDIQKSREYAREYQRRRKQTKGG